MRYLRASIIIGILASALVAVLYGAAAFRRFDLGLAALLNASLPPLGEDKVLQYTLCVLLSLGIAWATIDIPRAVLKIVVAGTALAQIVTLTWVLDLFDIYFSPFPSALAICTAFAAAFAYSQSEAGARKKIVRSIFGERISDRTFRKLVDSDLPLLYEGELAEATVVVCEIFNHDQLADTLAVPEYVAMNNSFLRNAADFLVERGGYLDECDGESLRVIFGTPLPDARHATTACEAALALAERLDEVNRECHRVWKQTFDFRIGVNSGEMVLAAYGSRRLGSFSVAGEPVDWARRLCSANLIYGSRIIVGSLTYQLAETDVEVRPLELVQRHPNDRAREEVYELLSRKSTLSEEAAARRDLFWKGVVYLREGRYDDAFAHFQLALPSDDSDGPLDFYLRRLEQLRGGAPALGSGESKPSEPPTAL